MTWLHQKVLFSRFVLGRYEVCVSIDDTETLSSTLRCSTGDDVGEEGGGRDGNESYEDGMSGGTKRTLSTQDEEGSGSG